MVLTDTVLWEVGFTAVLIVEIPNENEFWNVVGIVKDGTPTDVALPAVMLGRVLWMAMLDINEVGFGSVVGSAKEELPGKVDI